MIIVKEIMNTNNLRSMKVNLIFPKFHKLLCMQNFVEAKENSAVTDGGKTCPDSSTKTVKLTE